jgi:L-lactate dehydrogenase complex protein LldG
VNDSRHVLDRVRQVLGRGQGFSKAPAAPPAPPALPDSIVRLVGSDAKLPELFAQRAAELKMIVTPTTSQEAAEKLVAFARKNPIKRVALSVSALLDRLGIRAALQSAGFEVKSWDEITLDQMYDFDCAVTDVSYAVAESGTLVVKPSARQGRSMSLVPMYHIAFVEPTQFLPDMVDLFNKLAHESDRSNVILISGPSKTADIEMNVVTGVHGPNVVNTFILR